MGLSVTCVHVVDDTWGYYYVTSMVPRFRSGERYAFTSPSVRTERGQIFWKLPKDSGYEIVVWGVGRRSAGVESPTVDDEGS